jgi:LacI family repressor for deo operon, udp, cdd, tsx, nupC, and nupG
VPTIHDVARRARVSTATVSRVLSRPDVVADSTRQRVLKAVEQLGYAPNSAAANLRTLRSRKILVTVPDIANPFFALILQGIEDAAHARGYAVLVGDTQHDEQREERYAQMLRRKEADGLIFLGHRLPASAAGILDAAGPGLAPIVNGCEFSPRLGVPSVHIDNAKAAGEAVTHLLGLGHRRIGAITGPLASPLSRDRLRGARAAARQGGVELATMQGDFSLASGSRAAEVLLRQPKAPTALFCFNDEMAMGALQAARRLEHPVPRDVSIVGFDDIRFARYTDPPLTTIAQPMREIGEGVVQLLLEILGGASVRPASITLPHALMVRASTVPPRPTRGRRA